MIDPRTDPELVAAARSGDQQAFAAIYDRYADRVYGLCTTVTRDRGIAEDATAETFLSAWNRLEQLRDPAQLRPWLFAIARNRAIKLGTRAAKLVPADTLADTVSADDTTDEIDAGGDAAELQQMVWDAAEGLNPSERAVLDLQIRQGLEESEIAQVMGITIEHTYVLTSRMRKGLETSMGALFIARKGREDCKDLQQVLADWDGAYSPLIRKRVNRHIESCETCEAKKRHVNPFAAFAAAPAFAVPAALRGRVLNDMQRISFRGDWRADKHGFPKASPGSNRRSPLVPMLAAAAVIVLLLGLGGFVLRDNESTSKAEGITTSVPGTSMATGDSPTPGATTEPAASTTEPTAAPSTTTSTPPTTTSAPDTAGPTISGSSVSPARITKVECTRYPRTLAINVTATDPSGVSDGTARASIGGIVQASASLAGGGSSWSATLGPFPAGTPSGQITVTIEVRDTAGNASSATGTSYLEARCV